MTTLQQAANELVELIESINLASDDLSKKCFAINDRVAEMGRKAGVEVEMPVGPEHVLSIQRSRHTRNWGVYVGRLRTDKAPYWVGLYPEDGQTMSRDEKVLLLSYVEDLIAQWRSAMAQKLADLQSVLK